MSEGSVLTWLSVLGSLAWKSLIVFLLAGAALLALRRASAAARHLVCLLTLAALLVLPVLSLALPGWRLTVLSAPQSGREPTPRQVAAPPETGGGRVSDASKAGVASGAPTTPAPIASVLNSLSSRSGRTPASEANKEVGSTWPLLLAFLWLTGALLAALRPLLGLWGIARLSHDSASVADPPTLALTAECASVLGLSQTPALRQAVAPVPMTWGWQRPIVLLPTEAHGWPQDRLRAVLLHELAHVRRRDWLFHRFADIVCALYWFHPLVWLTARRLRAESEIACDDLVLTSGIAAPDYARHLLDVAHALRPAVTVPQAAIAMARTARIEGRLRMILDTRRPRRALTRRVLLLVLGTGAAALVPLAMLRPAARASAPGSASPQHPVSAAKGRSITLLSRSNHPPIYLQAAHFSMLVSGPAKHQTMLLVSSADLTLNGTALLAGMTNADKPGAAWWSASGIAIRPVYNTAENRAQRHAHGGGAKNVLFAFRLPENIGQATVKYNVVGALESSSEGTWPFKVQTAERLTESAFDANTGGTRVLTASFPASASRATVQVAIASGPWHKAAEQAPTRYAGSSTTTPEGTFIFSAVTPEKGNIWGLTVTTGDPTQDIRIVGVDAQGHVLLPSTIGDTTAGGLDQITARFAQPLTSIQEFRVETRPFQWMELKDIALRPAK